MSVVLLQIGQCGNQLGEAFYNFLYNECKDASLAHQAMVADTFFFNDEKSNKLCAKSILVDMEPKVVNRCIQNHVNDNWSYNSKFSFCKQEGSGNNWAYGFNIHGQKCKTQILECIGKMIEQIDYCEGILLLQSLAGGTGSGLGSFILELINDEYPELSKLNLCVVPHLSGEVILQNYNCVLTIQSLYQHSDGIILIENDLIETICNKLLQIKRPSLNQINNVISHQLNSLMFPVIESSNVASTVFSSLQNQFGYFRDIIDTLLLDPQYKLLSIRNVPQMPEQSKSFSNDQWSALEKRISQMLISNCSEAQINWNIKPESKQAMKSVANLLIARGTDVQKQDFQMINNKEMYKGKRVKQLSLFDSHAFNKCDKNITVLGNSQICVEPLDVIISSAQQKFQEKAYVYQYEKFGLTSDDFIQGFAICEQILSNYQNM